VKPLPVTVATLLQLAKLSIVMAELVDAAIGGFNAREMLVAARLFVGRTEILVEELRHR
jgi:hypothetical protein